MSTNTGTLTMPSRSPAWLQSWAMFLIGSVAVAALVMSILALRTNAPQSAAPSAAVDTAVYEQSQPVTGTGPGLVFVADASILRGIYERSGPATGTGPDAAELSNSGIYHRSGQVTGTGPGLVQIAGPR
jgi:hypothetical protein